MKRPLLLLPLLALAAGCRTIALDDAKLFPEPFSDFRLGMSRERFAEIRQNAVWPASESDTPVAVDACRFNRKRDGSTELVEVRLLPVRGNKGREAPSAEDVLAETIARLGEPSSRKIVWRIGFEFDTRLWIDGRTVVLFERELSFDGLPSKGERWCYSVASRKTFDEKESYSRNLLDPAFTTQSVPGPGSSGSGPQTTATTRRLCGFDMSLPISRSPKTPRCCSLCIAVAYPMWDM